MAKRAKTAQSRKSNQLPRGIRSVVDERGVLRYKVSVGTGGRRRQPTFDTLPLAVEY